MHHKGAKSNCDLMRWPPVHNALQYGNGERGAAKTGRRREAEERAVRGRAIALMVAEILCPKEALDWEEE